MNTKLLLALSNIGTQHSTAIEYTATAVHMILDYVVTYPNGGITHWASNMILSAPSDAGCLSKSKARSDAGTHILLSENEHVPRLNGAVLTISQMIKLFIYLSPKADLAGLFITAKTMVPMHQTLIEMG